MEIGGTGMTENSDKQIALCSCGAAAVHVSGAPRSVYGCSCAECQRATGSIFAYRAIYPLGAVQAVHGELRRWRRTGDSGRWLDQFFCPECGVILYMAAEAMPGAISVSVGCFGDPNFAAPTVIHNLQRAHCWWRAGWPQREQ